MILIYLGSFCSAMALCVGLTILVRNFARARGWVFEASADRHVHQQPIPRLGGTAIYASFVGIMGLLLAGSKLLGTHLGFSYHAVAAILGPATLVFLLGLYDDLRPLKAPIKFAVQGLAAGWLFLSGFRIVHVGMLFGDRQLGSLLGLLLTVFWVLLITNAFNLIDGLDGLAAGSALFSTLIVLVVSLVRGMEFASLATIILAGAMLGFLRFNFNPATIFLGDCGSLFIGFMLSALALIGNQKSPTIVAVAIPVLSFGLPILETTLSVIRRFLAGKPLFTGDREHIHHVLLKRGFTQQQAVMLLYAVTALFGLLSLFTLLGSGILGLVLLVVGAGTWVGIQNLGYHEFGELRRMAQRTMEQKRVIMNNLEIRRATEDLRNCRTFKELSAILEDAFEDNDFDSLDLTFTPSRLPLDADVRPFLQEASGELRFTWTRTRPADLQPAWALHLDLVAGNGSRRGTLAVYRNDTTRPVMVDINLLTGGFHQTLTDALERVALAASEPAAAYANMAAARPS